MATIAPPAASIGALPSELIARVVSAASPRLGTLDQNRLAGASRALRAAVDEAQAAFPWHARRSIEDAGARVWAPPGPAGVRIVGEEAIGLALSADGSRLLLVLRSAGPGSETRCAILPGGPSLPMHPARAAAAWVGPGGEASVVAYDEGSSTAARHYVLERGAREWAAGSPRSLPALQAARAAVGERSAATGAGGRLARIEADGTLRLEGPPGAAGPAQASRRGRLPTGARPTTVAFGSGAAAAGHMLVGTAPSGGSRLGGTWLLGPPGATAARVVPAGRPHAAVPGGPAGGWVFLEGGRLPRGAPVEARLLRDPASAPETVGWLPPDAEPVACVGVAAPSGLPILGLADGRLFHPSSGVLGRGSSLRVAWAAASAEGGGASGSGAAAARAAYEPSTATTHLRLFPPGSVPEPFDFGRAPGRGLKRAGPASRD